MPLTRTTTAGRGKTSFRLSIEGLPFEFVTNRAQEATAADGRRRVAGLSREGLIIDDRVDLAKACVDAQGMTVAIGELPWARFATQCFAQRPSIVTYLTADLTAAGTTITLLSTTGMLANDVIHIGRESIKIGAVSGDGVTLTGCSRAYWNNGVPAFAHYTADGDRLMMPEVTNRPDAIEGRRAFLYMYDESMLPTSDGVLVWRGVCGTEAREEGRGAYSIVVDSVARLLDQDIGGDLDEPVKARGIYYPWNTYLDIRIRPRTGPNYDDPQGPCTTILIAGEFYETQEDFAAALNTKIAASAAAAYGVLAQVNGDAGWYFTVTPTAAGGGPFYVDVQTWFEQIDETHGLVDERALCVPGTTGGASFGAGVDTVAADTTYVVPHRNAAAPDGAGLVPRGSFGGRLGVTAPASEMDHTPAAGENYRIYLGGAFVPDATTTAVDVHWPDTGETQAQSVVNYSSSERWIELADAGGIPSAFARSLSTWHQWTSQGLPEITPGRRFSAVNFAEVLVAITDAAPAGAELGATPNLTTADIDTSSSATAILGAIGGAAWLARRDYTQFGSCSLADLFAGEAQLTGVIPTIGADGRIVYRAWGSPVPTSTGHALAGAEVLTDRGFPAWEKNANGSVSRIILKRGWVPREQEYGGQDLIVRDVAAISRNPTARDLEIKPLSRAVIGEDSLTYDDLKRATSTLLGVLGHGYETVTVSVPFTWFRPHLASSGVLCGDTVFLTCSTLPDTTDSTGHRGVVDAPCLVIGRHWDLGSGVGQLTLLLTSQRVTGYAPVLRVSSQVDEGDDKWTITCTFSAPTSGSYQLTGDVAQAFDDVFAIGDRVRVREHDSDAPTTVSGLVTEVSATTVKVQFDAAWTPGASTWILCYDAASASPSTRQRTFAYLADAADGKIGFGTGDEAARQVA